VREEDGRHAQVGDETPSQHSAGLLRRALTVYDMKSLQDLVKFWLAKGVNLALAGPLVEGCIESMNNLRLDARGDDQRLHDISRSLSGHSAEPLSFNESMSFSHYTAQFLGNRARWETLGIFFTSVVRATVDVSFFPATYKTTEEQMNLRRFASGISDCCLENCLSLDCLNDLQLFLQYESFIMHAAVDGDHSEWLK
jgi:hypothetical protein